MEAHQDSRMKKTWMATWWWWFLLPTSMTLKATKKTLKTLLLLQRKLRKLQLTLTPTRQATTAVAKTAYLTLLYEQNRR